MHRTKSLFLFQFRTYVTKVKANSRIPLITCKIKKFEQFHDTVVPQNIKFGKLPLASSGWEHYKAKGDYFIIHPTPNNDVNSISEETKSFHELFQFNDQLINNLNVNFDIKCPSYIQSNAIPIIRDQHHTLIAAETGSGKTLAYLLPIVEQVLKLKEKIKRNDLNTPFAVILTPGRDLGKQIGEVAKKLCSQLDVNIKVVCGGETQKLIHNPTFDEIDILVGSMGVVSKLVTTNIYRMHEVRHVVLDEADTMLDDSFSEKLSFFLRRFPFYKNHLQSIENNIVGTQLIMAAATLPTNINELLRNVIDPETIHEVKSPYLHKILPNVTQIFKRVGKTERAMKLLETVKNEIAKNRPIIIFSNKSITSNWVSLFLRDHEIESVNLNGDMNAHLRLGQFDKFQNGDVHVLSTTDIASRGLDTRRARHILNFDFPLYVADYIHRIGRIGRIGSHEECVVTNFVIGLRDLQTVQRIEHTARTSSELSNVNANVTNIIAQRIIKNMEKEDKAFLSTLK